jgi:hypothetical protein
MRGIHGRNVSHAQAYMDIAREEGLALSPVELDVQSEESVREAIDTVVADEGRPKTAPALASQFSTGCEPRCCTGSVWVTCYPRRAV